MKNIVEFKNVYFSYDENTPIFEDFNLEIKKGKYTVLLGENGSGKSTLAKLITKLIDVNKGDINVFDMTLDDKNISEVRNHVSIVFQNPDNQFIGSTVEDDIAFGLENRNVKQEEMKAIIDYYAEKVGMIDYLKKEPEALSGGQKQRVAIAGALALKPDLLILDEATSMLDPKGKKEILNLIDEIKKENPEMSILSITHHIDEAIRADEIIVLNKGKVVAQGTPNDILFDGKLLEDNSLLPPFIIQVLEEFKAKGIDIANVLTIDELVEKLWR